MKKKFIHLPSTSSLLLITLSVMIIALGWINYSFSDQFPEDSRFLRPWSAVGSFIQNGLNPYSNQVSYRTQILFYGESPGPESDPLFLDQTFTSAILYFPLALIKDYKIARVLYLTLSELVILLIPFLCISLMEWKPSRLFVTLLLFAIVLSPPFIQMVVTFNPAIFIVFFILLGLFFLKQGLDEFAGIAFIVGLFQPSLTGLFMMFILFWIIRNKRWRVIWGWLMTVILLLVISIALVPDWILSFIKTFRVQSAFRGYQTLLSILTDIWPGIGGKFAIALTVIVVITLVYEWFAMKVADEKWFIWTLSLTICAYPLIGFPFLPDSLIVLVIPLSYFLIAYSKRYADSKNSIFILIGILLQFTIAWLIYYFRSIQNQWILGNFILNVMIPILLIAGLYSIRWWVIRYPKNRLIIGG